MQLTTEEDIWFDTLKQVAKLISNSLFGLGEEKNID